MSTNWICFEFNFLDKEVEFLRKLILVSILIFEQGNELL